MKLYTGLPKGAPELVAPQEYYEELYADDLEEFARTWGPWNKRGGKFLWYAAMELAIPPVIDVGCGAGHLAAMYAAFGKASQYLVGIDYCPSAIEIARRKHAPWATFVVGNASGHRDLLETTPYQTAIFLEVLEHVYEDLELLRKVPSGRHVVASVPSFHTTGHCRWFASRNQVKQRYQAVLKLDRIVVEAGLGSDNRWFVLKGRRR